ncbi:hypothetical protein U1Q18_026523 [Sarracenia purpurea var. burkii]
MSRRWPDDGPSYENCREDVVQRIGYKQHQNLSRSFLLLCTRESPVFGQRRLIGGGMVPDETSGTIFVTDQRKRSAKKRRYKGKERCPGAMALGGSNIEGGFLVALRRSATMNANEMLRFGWRRLVRLTSCH